MIVHGWSKGVERHARCHGMCGGDGKSDCKFLMENILHEGSNVLATARAFQVCLKAPTPVEPDMFIIDVSLNRNRNRDEDEPPQEKQDQPALMLFPFSLEVRSASVLLPEITRPSLGLTGFRVVVRSQGPRERDVEPLHQRLNN